MTGRTALILGASGKIGSAAATAFAAAGWTIRRYVRGSDMTAAARGADVIVNGLNPPNYHDWARILPAITDQVITAARASGATIILPGNVYNFGDTSGTWSEHTPQRPVSRKGRLRVEMERSYRESGLPVIVLRAGNFIAPGREDDFAGLVLLRRLGRGQVLSAGDPDVMQAYCYLPDWARAALALAEMREDLPTFADIPFPGHAFTTRHLRDRLERLTGRDLALGRFPWWIFTLTAPVWELAREMNEMRYLYETDHRLDDATFDRLLPGFAATPLDEVLRSCLPEGSAPRAGDVHPDQPVRP